MKAIAVCVKRVALQLPQFVGITVWKFSDGSLLVASSELGGQEASGFGSVLQDR